MRNLRLIARLDIKGPNLIKGVRLEGLRKMGPPEPFATEYYETGADEIIYMDSVASLYGRNHLSNIISEAVKNIFIPITVGGGIRSVDDVTSILRSGADKVAVSTAAVEDQSLISKIAKKFGSQCMVISIEAKKITNNKWEVLTNNGREKTGLDVLDWAKKAVKLGAGEILLTSIDQEGTRTGFDVNLVKSVTETVNVPVIASGGMGCINDLSAVVESGGADAVAMADILHYKRSNIPDIRDYAKSCGFKVRNI